MAGSDRRPLKPCHHRRYSLIRSPTDRWPSTHKLENQRLGARHSVLNRNDMRGPETHQRRSALGVRQIIPFLGYLMKPYHAILRSQYKYNAFHSMPRCLPIIVGLPLISRVRTLPEDRPPVGRVAASAHAKIVPSCRFSGNFSRAPVSSPALPGPQRMLPASWMSMDGGRRAHPCRS